MICLRNFERACPPVLCSLSDSHLMQALGSRSEKKKSRRDDTTGHVCVKFCYESCVETMFMSSLTGLRFFGGPDPALKCWANVFRPCGTLEPCEQHGLDVWLLWVMVVVGKSCGTERHFDHPKFVKYFSCSGVFGIKGMPRFYWEE